MCNRIDVAVIYFSIIFRCRHKALQKINKFRFRTKGKFRKISFICILERACCAGDCLHFNSAEWQLNTLLCASRHSCLQCTNSEMRLIEILLISERFPTNIWQSFQNFLNLLKKISFQSWWTRRSWTREAWTCRRTTAANLHGRVVQWRRIAATKGWERRSSTTSWERWSLILQ